MRRVILESPYAGDVQANEAFARACLRDCLSRGEAPFASHLLYTQVLDDQVGEDRRLGIEAGMAWASVAEATVVYMDHRLSPGMAYGVARADLERRPVEWRWLKPAHYSAADLWVSERAMIDRAVYVLKSAMQSQS